MTASLGADLALAVILLVLAFLFVASLVIHQARTHDWITRTTRRGTTPEDAYRTCERCGQSERREFELGKGWTPWRVTTAGETPCKYGGGAS